MSDIVRENSGQKRCKHIIGEGNTSTFEDYLVMGRESVEGTSSGSAQVAEASQGREVFKRFPSKAKLCEVLACAREFHFLTDCRMYVPAKSSHVAYPPSGFVAISPQHFELGFRFPLAPYLLKLLNELKLAPFQLTLNSYAQLTSLGLLFFLGITFLLPL